MVYKNGFSVLDLLKKDKKKNPPAKLVFWEGSEHMPFTKAMR